MVKVLIQTSTGQTETQGAGNFKSESWYSFTDKNETLPCIQLSILMTLDYFFYIAKTSIKL